MVHPGLLGSWPSPGSVTGSTVAPDGARAWRPETGQCGVSLSQRHGSATGIRHLHPLKGANERGRVSSGSRYLYHSSAIREPARATADASQRHLRPGVCQYHIPTSKGKEASSSGEKAKGRRRQDTSRQRRSASRVRHLPNLPGGENQTRGSLIIISPSRRQNLPPDCQQANLPGGTPQDSSV